MRRGNNSGSNGQSLSAAPVTAHTLAKHVITPPGYHFESVRTDADADSLIPLFAAKARAYYHPTLLETTLAEARKRAESRAGGETVRYPQDSTPTADGQELSNVS